VNYITVCGKEKWELSSLLTIGPVFTEHEGSGEKSSTESPVSFPTGLYMLFEQ
jgi:hypothetical protein